MDACRGGAGYAARIAVYEVASFYSMYETQPVGRHCVAVCTNISCMLMGSQNIVDHVESKFGIKLGQSTPDGRIFLKVEEECLAACAGGPMMQVDHVYHTEFTTGKSGSNSGCAGLITATGRINDWSNS